MIMNEMLKQIQDLLSKDKYKDCELKNAINQIITEKEKLNLKFIKELEGLNFNIPSFQRGYRWKKQQVEDLLRDINEFANTTNEERAEFYCLQPVVVMNKENGLWDVIDGQQRLTTIFLILKYLGKNQFYSLKYKTRKDSELDLPIVDENHDVSSINEYHFVEAYKAIIEWFKDEQVNKEKWKETLLGQTKVIWYQVDERDQGQKQKDSIDAFMRLNSGKIPLTNSEMIRALFIINCFDYEYDSDEIKLSKQQKLSVEWDNLERELQNDDFWNFITLNNPFKKNFQNRIEYIFDLIEDGSEKDHQDKYSTYRMYEKRINGKEKVQDLWLTVKQYYWRFHEWYTDSELYHLIGYCWVTDFKKVKELMNEAEIYVQSDLIDKLKNCIKNRLASYFEDGKIEILQYSEGKDDRDKITNILKLFNVYTHMQENSCCPFSLYKNTQWSLEHIHAQNSQDLHDEDWIKWAKESSASDNVLQDIIMDWDSSQDEKKQEIKNNFESKIGELFGDIEDYMHSLMNMALLGKSANSALSNKIFPQKRNDVLSYIENKEYLVPIATRNVFLKYYNQSPGEMQKWTIDDCRSYGKALIKCFEKFNVNGISLPELINNGEKKNAK